MSWLSSMFGGGKKAPSYTPTPYSGRSPESPSFTKESEKAYFEEILPRSQGIGVGYAPEWMSESQKVLQSNYGRSLKDQLRNSAGSLSAFGLSGNPRAYEATSGRIQRDTDENLQNALSKLTISDMERKNQERDVNTERLGRFNEFEFGQGNRAADFDLSKWSQENQQALSAAELGSGNYWRGLNNQSQMISDLGQTALAIGMPETSPSIAMSSSSGQGISPSASSLGGGGYSTSLKQSPEYARLMRLQV